MPAPWLLIQKFLDAYTLCDRNQNRLFELLKQERKQNWPKPSLDDLIADGITDSDDEENLIRAFWSLEIARQIHQHYKDELDRRESYDTSERFGPVAYWLSVDPAIAGSSRLSDRIPPKSRFRERKYRQLSLESYHAPLLVTREVHDERKINRVPIQPELETWFADRIRRGTFRIAMSPLSTSAEFAGECRECTLDPPVAFHLTSVGPLKVQEAALLAVLEEANSKDAAILVLPELRMPPSLLAITRDFLANRPGEVGEKGILMVVAGSWHVKDADGRFRNRSVVLNRHGEDIWTHDKSLEYLITPDNVTRNEALRRIGIDERGAIEDIKRGLTLPIYDSVLGRIAVAICLDFIGQDARELMQKSGAEIFLVPAMTPTTRDFEIMAQFLVEQRAFTFVANCGTVGLAPALSFWMKPAKGNNLKKIAGTDSLLFLDLKDISR